MFAKTTLCAIVVAVAALRLRRDMSDMLTYALAVRHRFGLPKAIGFAIGMRLGFMDAFPGTNLDGFVSFDGGYEKTSPSDKLGIVFFPGALVNPIAYAPLLRLVLAKLRRKDVAIICASYPCLRNPVVFPPSKRAALLQRHKNIKTWVVAGHSMGAGSYGAAAFVSDLRSNRKKGDSSPNVNGLIMLAGTITGNEVNLHNERDLSVLAILASEDTIVPPEGSSEAGTPVRQGIDEKCPRSTTRTLVINGGNHAGFGHYGPQRFPFPDGERTITLDEQQEITATHIASFLDNACRKVD